MNEQKKSYKNSKVVRAREVHSLLQTRTKKTGQKK